MVEPSREALLRKLRAINARAEDKAEAPLGCLLTAGESAQPARAPLKLVAGIEDTVYFQWQLALLCESLVGQLPAGSELLVVLCNDHRPLSPRMEQILRTYGVRHFTSEDHPRQQQIDFSSGPEEYRALNKIQALRAVADRVSDDDLICLMDTDVFLYRDFDPEVFPTGNAICHSWIVAEDRFLAHTEQPGSIDLRHLLASIGVEDDFARGSATIFFEGATVRNPKFVQDCFRFTQIVYLLARVQGMQNAWLAEMPCYSLAFAANGIDATTLDTERFVVDARAQIEPGSFYHYYRDFADTGKEGAFPGSLWCKQQFGGQDLLEADLSALRDAAGSDHEDRFFELAERANERLSR